MGGGRHLLLKRGWASALKVELSVGQWSRKQCLVASFALKRVPKANVASVGGCWPWDFKGTERTSILQVPSSRAAHGQTPLWPPGHGDHPDPDLAIKAPLLACSSLSSAFSFHHSPLCPAFYLKLVFNTLARIKKFCLFPRSYALVEAGPC